MVVKVRMPRIDANVEEGTIGKWLVAPGDPIAEGQPLVEIITDKASFELEADCTGVFARAVASEKSVVPVGYVIALVRQGGDEALPDVEEENAALLSAYRDVLLSGGPPEEGTSAPPAGPAAETAVWATPAARKLAMQEGVSLEELAQRVGGVVQKADVECEIQRLRGGGT